MDFIQAITLLSELQISIPKGNLNVPRNKMPQIKSTDVPEFITFLKDRGIKVDKKDMPVSNIKPTQKDINKEKVVALSTVKASNLKKPVIISKDFHLLDGHHRWLALLNQDPKNTIPANIVNVDIKSLLNLARDFPKTTFKTILEKE